MFITVTHSGKDKKTAYVRLMEAYRNEDGKKRARVIKNYGRLDALLAEDPLALDKLKKKYNDERIAKKKAIAEERVKSALRVIEKSEEPKPLSFLLNFNPVLHYGHYAVRSIWDRDLGLGQVLESLQQAAPEGAGYKFSINDAVFFMTAVTAMDPDTSLGGCGYTDYTDLDLLGNPRKDASPEDLYAALHFLKDSKDSILGWCRKKLDEKFGRDRSSCLVLFTVQDVRLPQHTSLALIIDENGIPADYELFSGRAAERSSLKGAIEKLKDRNKIQPAVVMADSRLKNKAWCLTTMQELDPGFHIVLSGKASDADSDAYNGELSTAQQAFLKQNLPLLKKSFERRSWSLPDTGHIQGHMLVCILAQLLLQLLSCRLEQQGTKLPLQEICTNLFGANVTAFAASAAEPVFLLSAGQSEARGRNHIIYSTHMPDIMRACSLTPLVRMTKLPEQASALGTSFASPADACPLLSAKFFA